MFDINIAFDNGIFRPFYKNLRKHNTQNRSNALYIYRFKEQFKIIEIII